MQVPIVVYVCPTDGNYYGSSNMGDMESVSQGLRGQNFEKLPENRHHSRKKCPVCGEDRVRTEIMVDLDDVRGHQPAAA